MLTSLPWRLLSFRLLIFLILFKMLAKSLSAALRWWLQIGSEFDFFFLIRNRNSLLSRNNPDNEQYSATSVSGFGLEAGRREQCAWNSGVGAFLVFSSSVLAQ